MNELGKIEWGAPEYEERERSQDWFWALGTIIIAASLASIIYSNYFFAALVIIAGVLLGFFARKKPEIILYGLSEDGLHAGPRLFPYENITGFWVETRGRFLLFVKTERLFLPIISIPIPEDMAEEIHEVFTQKSITEEEMQEHTSEKIMDALGF
jgi:hypothetical protein